MENTGTDEKTLDPIDRISQLPDEIIHQIMGYLQSKKDIARTSVLSRRWRESWLRFSTVIFYQHNFIGRNFLLKKHSLEEFNIQKEMFRKFVDESLLNRVKQNLSIHKMVLRVDSFDQEMAADIDGWLRVATEREMRELYLLVTNLYTFPQSIIASERIIALRVSGCKLDATCGLKLSNLQRLYLGNLNVDDKVIENLVSCCPSLVDLSLIRCSGLKKLKLKAPKLETLLYDSHNDVVNITICLYHARHEACLKNFSLEHRYMDDRMFRNGFSSFFVLEKLTLNNCNWLQDITISTCYLKTLIVRFCIRLENVHVDAPNLLSLEYTGSVMPFSSLDPSNLNEAKFIFYPEVVYRSRTLWYPMFVDFLKKFGKSRGLKIVARTKKDVIFYEDMERVFASHGRRLEFEIVKSYSHFDHLFEHVLNAWNPRTVSIVSSSRSNLWKVASEKLNNRDKDPNWCKGSTFNHKCWCHCLKGFKVEDVFGYQTKSSSFSGRIDLKEPFRDETINEAVCDRMATAWISMLRKNEAQAQQIICFKLLWDTCKHPKQLNLPS